jgi:hypothetical protein
MDKLMRYTILAVIGGVILAFNMYQADYKLLTAQQRGLETEGGIC